MKKNLIIAIFSVVIAFMAGYIIAGKYNMMLSNDDENDSTQLYDNGREQREGRDFSLEWERRFDGYSRTQIHHSFS